MLFFNEPVLYLCLILFQRIKYRYLSLKKNEKKINQINKFTLMLGRLVHIQRAEYATQANWILVQEAAKIPKQLASRAEASEAWLRGHVGARVHKL